MALNTESILQQYCEETLQLPYYFVYTSNWKEKLKYWKQTPNLKKLQHVFVDLKSFVAISKMELPCFVFPSFTSCCFPRVSLSVYLIGDVSKHIFVFTIRESERFLHWQHPNLHICDNDPSFINMY